MSIKSNGGDSPDDNDGAQPDGDTLMVLPLQWVALTMRSLFSTHCMVDKVLLLRTLLTHLRTASQLSWKALQIVSRPNARTVTSSAELITTYVHCCKRT